MLARCMGLRYEGPLTIVDNVVLMAGDPDYDDVGKTVRIRAFGARVAHGTFYMSEDGVQKRWPVDFGQGEQRIEASSSSN